MNRNRLEYEMKERGITVDVLCAGIGISRSAFYRKCNGKSEFTLPEINGIIRLLSLSSEVASLIFWLKCVLKDTFDAGKRAIR